MKPVVFFDVPISFSEIELIKSDLILSMVTHFFCDLKYIFLIPEITWKYFFLSSFCLIYLNKILSVQGSVSYQVSTAYLSEKDKHYSKPLYLSVMQIWIIIVAVHTVPNHWCLSMKKMELSTLKTENVGEIFSTATSYCKL